MADKAVRTFCVADRRLTRADIAKEDGLVADAPKAIPAMPCKVHKKQAKPRLQQYPRNTELHLLRRIHRPSTGQAFVVKERLVMVVASRFYCWAKIGPTRP
mmetsp:Transcript_104376/g.202190  ORF Transcript_104376/g.202190 Transcript_104376/m.202190 type:complete len:101 (-) Transcript_104376:4-306(-)